MRTLRQRLILSHIIPVLLITPLIGFALVFVLERQVILVNLARQLNRQAGLLAETAADYPEIWNDTAQAQAFTDRFSRRMTAQLSLLDEEGRVLASSDRADAGTIGRLLNHPDLDAARAGNATMRTDYSQERLAEVADVMLPVLAADGAVIGIVRVTQVSARVQERFQRLRGIILDVLVAGLLLGSMAGLALAFTLERPLAGLTRSVYQLAHGEQLQPLPERGPAELRQLARAFNILVERLNVLKAARRRLLANLIHEIGRPLGALRSANQALISGASQDPALGHDLLRGMETELRRLQRLLDDLARFYEQALGALDLDLHPVDLNGWLPAVLGPWREAARRKGLQWQVDVPTALPAVPIDSDRLGQALGNLLSNAVKYTPAGGAVTVQAGTADHAIWIGVGDSGEGIPAEEQTQIFEPFYRGRLRQRFPEGMGLGLAITRDLVQAHGGRIEVDSAPGEGSQFTIWLPLS